ncbi:MAG: hypothetical protein AABY13_03750 [Nanoarchaeota archaeon]
MHDVTPELRKALLHDKAERAAAIISNYASLEIDLGLFELFVQDQGFGALVFCVDRSPASYRQLLTEKGVNDEAVFYLDVTGAGDNHPNTLASLNIGNLSYLTLEVFQMIETAQKRFPQRNFFVLLDSVGSMQLYNEPETLARFLHANNLRFRALNVYQTYLLEPNGKLNNVVRKFCDNILELGPTKEEAFARAIGAQR